MFVLTKGFKEAAKRGAAYFGNKAVKEQLKKSEDEPPPKTEGNTPAPKQEEVVREPETTKMQDAEKVRIAEKQALNANPEKADGVSRGNMDKMENAQTIIENKEDYKLDNKIDSIIEKGEAEKTQSWTDRFTDNSKDESQSWADSINDERSDTEGGNKNWADRFLGDKSQIEPKEVQDIKEIDPTNSDPTVPTQNENPMEFNPDSPTPTQGENPTDINPDVTPDTPGDQSNILENDKDYDTSEKNEFAMLEARETNFFNNDTPQVDLSELNDQDMDRFSELANDNNNYTYDIEDRRDFVNLDNTENSNVNELEELSFYNHNEQREDYDDMDMADSGDDGGADGGGDG